MFTRNLEAKNQLRSSSGIKCASDQQKEKQKGMGKHCSPKRMATVHFITIYKGKRPPFTTRPQKDGQEKEEEGGGEKSVHLAT